MIVRATATPAACAVLLGMTLVACVEAPSGSAPDPGSEARGSEDGHPSPGPGAVGPGSPGSDGGGGTASDGGADGAASDGATPAAFACPAGTIDVAAYMIPDCTAGGPNLTMSNGERFQTRTFRAGAVRGFYLVKSADGRGFEEWWLDKDYVRIRRDTTWAYQSGADWCDMVCGSASACLKRWRGDQGDWAATEYQAPGAPSQAAPWYRRCVKDGETFTTSFTVAAVRAASCQSCGAAFTGPSSHTVAVARLASWHGMNDVLRMSIVGGGGAGEAYFYAKGRGWAGFTAGGGTEAYATQNGATVAPVDPCAGRTLGTICPL